MINTKKELIKFLAWTRNGTAFCTTWLLILIVLTSPLSQSDMLSKAFIGELILWTMGGAIIFSAVFTRLFIRKLTFTPRLTLFMLIFSMYECAFFYSAGIFGTKGSIGEWGIFVLTVLVLYLICIIIYNISSRKQCIEYADALLKYQQKRRNENE
ncbi:MAG: hypothetical protein IJ446_04805 [Oscillospiraceae bacterium]|nr:hypothetical protein [Oscillospiraceae bacterium]